MPLVPYPARLARHLPHAGKALYWRQRHSRKWRTCDDLSRFFHPVSPIQPPPLRGTSFHRKEGMTTRAPSLGRGGRAQRGGVGFLFGRRSRLLFAFPIGKEGPRQRRSGALVNDALVTIFFALFHPATSLSGSLRSPPSPRGEGFVSGTAALSQMPCFHSVQTKTALRGRALQSGFWFYYSTVTDFARFLGLSTSFPLLREV